MPDLAHGKPWSPACNWLMTSVAAIEMITSLLTNCLHADWLVSGMQFQNVKVRKGLKR